jgi:hypothetical protein
VTAEGRQDGRRARSGRRRTAAFAILAPIHAPILVALLLTLLLSLLVDLAAAPRAHADEETGFEVPTREEGGRGPAVLRGSYVEAAGPRDATGWGYLRFFVHNVDARAHTVTVFAGGEREGSARLRRRLEGGASATVFLPWLPGREFRRIAVEVAGVGSWDTTEWYGMRSSRSDRWALLAVDDRPGAKPALEAAFVAGEAALSTRRLAPGGRTAGCARVAAADLPDRWPLLSFADAIVIDASRPGLDAERQRTLLRALAAGGSLVVFAHHRLPSGPLASLIAGSPPTAGLEAATNGSRRGALGLGRWWASEVEYVAASSVLAVPQPGVTLLQEVIESLDRRSRFDASGTSRAVLPAQFSDRLEIPGIGRLPVRAFFFTLLGFALVAGTLSYVLLRRRKRLGAFLVLLPLLGIAVSGAILLYGLLSEGTGIRGSVRSISVLDQRAHEAVTRSGRTIYAAFSPGGLRLDAQTLLLSEDFLGTSYASMFDGDTPAILDLDLGEGARAGARALPSRVPITYEVTTVSPARERLRFRAQPDGRFEARFTPDFAPAPGPRTILLRDPTGALHLGGREGPLLRLEPKDEAGVVRDLLRAVADLPLAEVDDEWDDGFRGVRASRPAARSWPVPVSLAPKAETQWLQGLLPDTLPPGSYLALFERAPAFDDLALDVAWNRSVHLVHGLLSAEDLGE